MTKLFSLLTFFICITQSSISFKLSRQVGALSRTTTVLSAKLQKRDQDAVSSAMEASLVEAEEGEKITAKKSEENEEEEVKGPTLEEFEAESGASIYKYTKKNSLYKPKASKKEDEKEEEFNFMDEDGNEYDVPFIDEPRWYRVMVRKASEKTLTEHFSNLAEKQEGDWEGNLFDAFYPKRSAVAFRGSKDKKVLSIKYNPMVPGFILIKTKMDPDIADMVEDVKNVRYLVKNPSGLVVPLTDQEAQQIQEQQYRTPDGLSADALKIRVGEYVSIINGKHKGKYGIAEGCLNGRINVRLRSEYKDSHDSIDWQDLRYLEKPPEKNYKEMTAKDAVESLMVKEPHSQMLKYLRKEGLLEEILYPDGRSREDRENRGERGAHGADQDRSGREGGRSMRSIAKPSTPSTEPSGERKQWSPKEGRADDDEFFSFNKGPAGPRKSWTPKNREPKSSWGEALPRSDYDAPYASEASAAPSGMESMFTRANSQSSSKPSRRGNSPSSSGGANIEQEFDSFIEQMLREVDESAGSTSPSNSKSPADLDERDEVSLDWLDETDDDDIFAQHVDRDTTGGSAGKKKDRDDSERVLNDLLRDLKLNGSGPKKSSSSGGNLFKRNRNGESTGPFKSTTPTSYNSNSNSNNNNDSNSDSNSLGGMSQASKALDSGSDFDIESLFDDPDDSPPSRSTAGVASLDETLSSYTTLPPDLDRDRDRDSRIRASTGSGAGGGGGAPDINDFPSFEQYLDALVSHESGPKSSMHDKRSNTVTVAPAMADLAAAMEEKDFDTGDSGAFSDDSNGASVFSEGGAGVGVGGSLGDLSVKDLKTKLKTAGLKVGGNKAELVERLLQAGV